MARSCEKKSPGESSLVASQLALVIPTRGPDASASSASCWLSNSPASSMAVTDIPNHFAIVRQRSGAGWAASSSHSRYAVRATSSSRAACACDSPSSSRRLRSLAPSAITSPVTSGSFVEDLDGGDPVQAGGLEQPLEPSRVHEPQRSGAVASGRGTEEDADAGGVEERHALQVDHQVGGVRQCVLERSAERVGGGHVDITLDREDRRRHVVAERQLESVHGWTSDP